MQPQENINFRKKLKVITLIHASILTFTRLTRLENSCTDGPLTHLLVRNRTCPSITCGAPLDRRRATSDQI